MVFCSAVANDAKQRTAPVIAAVIFFIRNWEMTTCLGIVVQFNPGWLKHQLHSSDDLVELVVAELGICFAEIRPRMKVIEHQFEIVAANVVIEASDD